MLNTLKKNKYGYFELDKKPSEDELKVYYSEKYYQEAKGAYEKSYSDEEILYFHNKLEQKYAVLLKYLQLENNNAPKLLDVGCGEGWALKFFKDKGWNVTGLDYSEYGCKAQNPDCIGFIQLGNINEHIEILVEQQQKFHVILLDNVLEHVLDPLNLLNQCNKLLEHNGVLIIEVPNDFSAVQNYLLENRFISRPFWVAVPDHISYFNQEGLMAICSEAGFAKVNLIGDFPIDFNLFNQNTNYVENEVGRSCHNARVTLENFLHSISMEKTNELYRVLAELGLGRQIIGFFMKRGS